MSYKFVFSKKFHKELSKLDPNNKKIILAYITKNFNNIDDPRSFGKALKGNFKGMWRYRVGNYRLICDIQDNNFIILALSVDHRRDVYSK